MILPDHLREQLDRYPEDALYMFNEGTPEWLSAVDYVYGPLAAKLTRDYVRNQVPGQVALTLRKPRRSIK